MLKPNKRVYTKKEPFRDALLLLIVCEGGKREPQYFEYFNGLSTRIKILPIPCINGASAPNHLIDNANNASEKFDIKQNDEIWIVLDVDRWHNHIHKIQESCRTKRNWNIVLSNPCFEVWLYYHISDDPKTVARNNVCAGWKQAMQLIQNGGFDSARHPILIETAIQNSIKNFAETGYLPGIGSTQLFRLGQRIFEFVKDVLPEN